MPFDRALTLRNAEKLIRQGKVEAAIAEFVRIVEDQPQDWAAKNTLGDLYSRAGQTDKAVQQFAEIANNLQDEGAVAKAGAIYKKILKLKPDHEHSLMQVADILGTQRLFADARAHLNTLIDLRKARGDNRGALQAKVRLGSLDPEDYDGRLQAVSARVEMGDVGGALSDLKEIAGELAEKGRHPEAIDALQQAAKLNAEDDEIREKLLDVYIAAGDLARARECATSVQQFKTVAAALEAQGKGDEALDTLRQAANQHDYDNDLRAQVARAFLAKGDTATAAQYLTVESAGDDPELLMTVADIRLRSDQPEEGMVIVRRMLAEDPSKSERISLLGWTIAEAKPEAGFLVIEYVADQSVAQSDWPAAAAVLQEFVTRVPHHIPALMRLVEICVDGELEGTMYDAQAHLADAYIAAGAANEARFIAEDLVAREPWEKANIERFRRALVLLGESDPDAVIAARLAGESPFTSTDIYGSELPIEEEPEPPVPMEHDPAAMENLMASLAMAEEEPVKKPSAKETQRHKLDQGQFNLSANAIDLGSILGDFEEAPAPPPPAAKAGGGHVEVDISFDEFHSSEEQTAPAASDESGDLDAALGSMRDQPAKRSGFDDAEKEYKKALSLRSKGDIDGCIASLEKAARAPKLRFSASWLLARLYRDRNMQPEALEWLDRASHAQAPNVADGHQLLFELADGLEKAGEGARALAVLLELQADAGSYRDVDERIDRLTKVQARG